MGDYRREEKVDFEDFELFQIRPYSYLLHKNFLLDKIKRYAIMSIKIVDIMGEDENVQSKKL